MDFNRRKTLWALAITAATATGIAGASVAEANEQVILRLNFTPWAMHTQYFAALKQGFYADEGLDVEIRPASSGQQNEVLIATGREHFGVSNSDSFIRARGAGLPVVAVMADQPDTPFSVVTLKSSGIDEPAKLKGKKIAWFPANVPGLIEPLLKHGGLTRDDIEFVQVGRGSEVQLLASGGVDALFGYFYGQALTLEEKGFPTYAMPVRDYGVEFQGNIIYTNDDLVKNRPELVEKFLRATLRGLIWTKDNMEEGMNYIIEASPDRMHGLEVRKLKMIYEFYNTPAYDEYFGKMTDAKWKSSIDILASGGDLDRTPEPGELYTNQFLEKLPEAKELAKLVRSGS